MATPSPPPDKKTSMKDQTIIVPRAVCWITNIILKHVMVYEPRLEVFKRLDTGRSGLKQTWAGPGQVLQNKNGLKMDRALKSGPTHFIIYLGTYRILYSAIL